MDIVIQPENIFKRRRRLIVFDMDSTIVDAEVIQDNVTKSGLGIAFQRKEALNRVADGTITKNNLLGLCIV